MDKYYKEIKEELINNEITKAVKEYSKKKSDLSTYYNVGKLLNEAGKHYGEGIVKKYSLKLKREVNGKYSETNLKYMRQFYMFANSHAVSDKLSWTNYRILMSIKDKNIINYYQKQCIYYNLSSRELIFKIKNKEYERLDEKTKIKLINNENIELIDSVKDPIVINNKNNYGQISEKILQKIILEDISSFLKELGEGFCYISNEYKILIGDTYNYIDILLFNIKYNCYVVIELK